MNSNGAARTNEVLFSNEERKGSIMATPRRRGGLGVCLVVASVFLRTEREIAKKKGKARDGAACAHFPR